MIEADNILLKNCFNIISQRTVQSKSRKKLYIIQKKWIAPKNIKYMPQYHTIIKNLEVNNFDNKPIQRFSIEDIENCFDNQFLPLLKILFPEKDIGYNEYGSLKPIILTICEFQILMDNLGFAGKNICFEKELI